MRTIGELISSKWASLALLPSLLLACASSSKELETRRQSVIYQKNDLQDYFEVGEQRQRDLVKESTLALFYREEVNFDDPYDVQVRAIPSSESDKYCPETPYLSQPHGAHCTGTLIADDLVLSAGHCVLSQEDCEKTMFVFDYYLVQEDRVENILSSDDIFYCDELVVREESLEEDGQGLIQAYQDYAIVRLDRGVGASRKPVELQLKADSVDEGAPLLQVGTPLGTPIKVDDGASVQLAGSIDSGFFLGNTDGFSGGSGSGVYNEAGRLIGIYGGGRADFSNDPDRDCLAPVVLDSGGELITYAFSALQDYCARSPEDLRLCPACGDGNCHDLENPSSCVSDCPASQACALIDDSCASTCGDCDAGRGGTACGSGGATCASGGLGGGASDHGESPRSARGDGCSMATMPTGRLPWSILGIGLLLYGLRIMSQSPHRPRYRRDTKDR